MRRFARQFCQPQDTMAWKGTRAGGGLLFADVVVSTRLAHGVQNLNYAVVIRAGTARRRDRNRPGFLEDLHAPADRGHQLGAGSAAGAGDRFLVGVPECGFGNPNSELRPVV